MTSPEKILSLLVNAALLMLWIRAERRWLRVTKYWQHCDCEVCQARRRWARNPQQDNSNAK